MDRWFVGLAFVAGGFAVGFWLAVRFTPPLASTRAGALATWAIRILVGAAVAVFVTRVYVTIEYIHITGSFGGEDEGSGVDLAQGLGQALLDAGTLLAGASLVFLFAPWPEELAD